MVGPGDPGLHVREAEGVLQVAQGAPEEEDAVGEIEGLGEDLDVGGIGEGEVAGEVGEVAGLSDP